MKMKMRIAALSAGVALAALAGTAQATTFTFTDGGVANGSIDTSTGIVIINNTFSGTTDAGQEISGIQLIFSTTPGTAPTLSTQAGQLISFTGPPPPTPTSTGTFVSGSPTHWGATEVGATLFLATAGTGSVGGSPIDMIIGPGSGGSAPTFNYPNINSSIVNHEPSIWETGTFTLAGLSGLTITGVKLEFGTGPDTFSSVLSCDGPTCQLGGGGQSGETPLPAALPVFASGLGTLGFLSWRRRRKATN